MFVSFSVNPLMFVCIILSHNECSNVLLIILYLFVCVSVCIIVFVSMCFNVCVRLSVFVCESVRVSLCMSVSVSLHV